MVTVEIKSMAPGMNWKMIACLCEVYLNAAIVKATNGKLTTHQVTRKGPSPVLQNGYEKVVIIYQRISLNAGTIEVFPTCLNCIFRIAITGW